MNFVDLSSTIGLFASVILTINFLLGMLVSTRYRRLAVWQKMPKVVRKFNLVDIHNWTAYVAILLAVLHPALLLLDASAKFTFIDIVFPISAPTQRIFVAMGTLALLGIVVIIITSQKIIRKKMGFRTWKNIHLTAYIVALLFLVHGIVMDPELKNRPFDLLDGEKILSEVCFIVLAGAGLFRFRYYKKLHKELRSLKQRHPIIQH